MFETPHAGSAKNTVMTWNVADVSPEISRLRERGIEFEEYDFGEYKTVDGVMTDPEGGKAAWFKDSEGNIIGLTSSAQDRRPGSLSAMLAASDLARAKAWYSEKLGFAPMFELERVVAGYQSGKSTFSVTRPTSPGPRRTPLPCGGSRASSMRSLACATGA